MIIVVPLSDMAFSKGVICCGIKAVSTNTVISFHTGLLASFLFQTQLRAHSLGNSQVSAGEHGL